MPDASNYEDLLEEAGLDSLTRSQKNTSRLLKIIRRLETAGEQDSCALCKKRTYKDACVIIRPGFWIAPRSFHERDCPLKELLSKVHGEVVKEEEEQEKIWYATEGRRIARATTKVVRELLAKMKSERK